jgi:sulfide:quinone oxidoreductase
MHLAIDVITPHPFPLYPFGGEIGSKVADLLQRAGITLHTDTRAQLLGPDRVRLQPAGHELRPDRIVTLPTLTGPDVRGIPGDALDRFIPVDGRCRVRGTNGTVFAAGDGTDLPVKHGSLAAQQADTAAAGIAHLAGVGPVPVPLHPVLQGTLLTGDTPMFLEAHPVAGTSWRATVLSSPPWPADQLVVADELATYVADSAMSSTASSMLA